MTHHDALTGLPNRSLFHEYVTEAVARIKTRPENQIAVLCLDLDDFKIVNDTLGHPVGDELLLVVAQRLKNCLGEGDVVARFGGDEFGVIQAIGPADHSAERASGLALRILAAVREPVQIQGHDVAIGTSAGIVIAPGDGLNSDQLLKNADIALYRAKEEGRGTYRFFESEMDALVQARRALEVNPRLAMANDEFEIFYQPLVRLSSNEITGVKALLRWRHPVRGLISPAEFVPIAEETKLIVPLGEWVLRSACAEVARWSAEVRLAVNLSPVQFRSTDVPEIIASALSFSGLSPARLEVEITETTVIQEEERTLAALNKIRAMGVRISMDDFGTGYSSLSYLRKYPFDKIKIDQSFVRELSYATESQAIVQLVIGLAVTLDMDVTAEGVETEDQLVLLRAAGCKEAQGYLFSRPRPAMEIQALIANRNSSFTPLRATG
jgi:diguanylate cyclase (GGDEF)-like protein